MVGSNARITRHARPIAPDLPRNTPGNWIALCRRAGNRASGTLYGVRARNGNLVSQPRGHGNVSALGWDLLSSITCHYHRTWRDSNCLITMAQTDLSAS